MNAAASLRSIGLPSGQGGAVAELSIGSPEAALMADVMEACRTSTDDIDVELVAAEPPAGVGCESRVQAEAFAFG
jgi:hypothetical protein